jgi:hypothetical protein
MSSSVTSAIDMTGSITTLPEARTLMYVFEVSLEIKEDDGKGTFSVVGKDRGGFKLKTNLEKQLCLSIRQVSDNGPQLHIERCFGVLIAPGRHVRHSDMQLLEMVGPLDRENLLTLSLCRRNKFLPTTRHRREITRSFRRRGTPPNPPLKR